jgi:orotate phosphoribosyltransferase-like protein
VRYEVAVKSGREIRQERNEKIRELRAEGKTQQEIAEVVGVSQKQISNVLEVNCTQVQKTSKETQTEIAIRNGIHRNTQCRIDKIRTINSTIADQCEAKNITVAKAERIVGIAPTPLEIAIKAYNRLTDADKEKFADYIRNETTIDN